MKTTAVKERPILFSGEMVRAILDGRKTQTRRVVKPCKKHSNKLCRPSGNAHFAIELQGLIHYPHSGSGALPCSRDVYEEYCPYGKAGDQLWVRESFRVLKHLQLPLKEPQPVNYTADGFIDSIKDDYTPKPSIHMPRWASRIQLEITDIRVERLQDISEDDAVAEGIYIENNEIADTGDYEGYFKNYAKDAHKDCPFFTDRYGGAIASFQSLWESINGAGSWDANPWVWVVEFKPVEKV